MPVNPWLSFGIAILLSFLSGLGTGGGSLLMLWLTVVLQFPLDRARVINLMFFIPCALLASAFRWKQAHLHLGKLIPAVLAGCAGAYAGTMLSHNIDTVMLRKLFGILLLITGIRELRYRPKAGQ